MPRKVFIAGEILTAADVNTNLMDQAVMSFAGTAARGSDIPTPVEGMVAYLEDTNALTVYDGASWVPAASGATLGSGSILQVVQTVKNDSASWASSSYADITGMSVSITPRATSSKILVLAQLSHGGDWWNNNGNAFKLLRDSTDLMLSTGATTQSTIAGAAIGPAEGDSKNQILAASITFLDSPSTTSSVTYKIQSRRIAGATGTNYLNRDGNNSISASSSITVIEVAG